MYRPKPQQPQVHRLPKKPTMPVEKDLDQALREAEKVHLPVELPWGVEGQKSYLLSLQLGNDPIWSLYEGETANDNPVWRHVSRDLGLIYSMIFQSAPEEMISLGGSAPGQAAALHPSAILPPDSKAVLQGRLENMQVANVVQTIQMSQLSGRLHLFDQGEVAQVYFVDGSPVHSVTSEASGDAAVIEIMTWEQGEFRFYPEENTEEKTVTRRMEGMVMEGITLLDQLQYLNKQGLKPDSYLIRKEQRITLEEFKARLSNCAVMDMNAEMALYERCDGRARFQDILLRRPMTKVEWGPLLFNLVSCGLVSVCQTSPFAVKGGGSELDRGMVAGVLRSLVRAETGMYTYAALQYFIEREFGKSLALGMPLSLIVFEARIILGADPPRPLPVLALREISSRLEPLKRPFDLLAHYETFDFALLLPGSTLKSARMLGHRVTEMLINVPLMQGQTQRLLLAGGIVGTPEDTQDLGRFLSAARDAKNKAKEARVSLKAFSEL